MITIKKVLKFVHSAKNILLKNIFGVSEYKIWKAKNGIKFIMAYIKVLSKDCINKF